MLALARLKRLKQLIFFQTQADSIAAKAETLLCHTLPRLPFQL